MCYYYVTLLFLTIVLLDKLHHQVFGKGKVCEARRHVCTAARAIFCCQGQEAKQHRRWNSFDIPEEGSCPINVPLRPLPCNEGLKQVAYAMEHKPCVFHVFVKAVPEFCILNTHIFEVQSHAVSQYGLCANIVSGNIPQPSSCFLDTANSVLFCSYQ